MQTTLLPKSYKPHSASSVSSVFLCLFFSFFAQNIFASPWQENKAICQIFEKENLVGTFVVYDVTKNQWVGCNQGRANQRFIPASTFKIPNSLIGLETRAVSSVDEIFPYDGQPGMFSSWEKDMGLREAIRVSNVPVYQELARRITLEHMKENIKELHYGNMETGNQIDRFWLDGPLKISAVEQARFLASLAAGSLSFSQKSQLAVQEITQLDKKDNWALHGKTGTLFRDSIKLGWWVGWVVKDHHIYAFAMNVDIPADATNPLDTSKRIAVGKASLSALGLMK